MSPWNATERKLFRQLSTPHKIQLYLDTLKYNVADWTYSPREVLRTGAAHCFDGALFAAAALEQNGEPPVVIDIQSSSEDDDHLLALFKRQGCYGAIGKSNYTGCRYRDPVYRTLRELIMSYFDVYFNLAGVKTLRRYSIPFDLRKIRSVDWRTTTENLDWLGVRIDQARHFPVLTARLERELAPADERSFRAAVLGLDPRGAHRVRNSRL